MRPRLVFSSVFLLIFCFLSHLKAQRSQVIPTVGIEESAPIANTSLLQGESGDLLLSPGRTKLITIHLKGDVEDIIFQIKVPENVSSEFSQILIYLNHLLETSSYYNFTQPEALSIQLDYQTGQCSITGNNGFSISTPINDNSYHISTSQERFTDDQTMKLEQSDCGHFSLGSFLEITGGIVGVFIIGATVLMFLKKRKRKNSPGNIIPDPSYKENYFSNKQETEAVYTSRILMQGMSETKIEACQTIPDTQSPLEVPNRARDMKGKIESCKTQETVKTLSLSTCQNSYKFASLINLKLLSEDNLCAEGVDLSTDIDNASKIHSLPSISSQYNTQTTLKNEANSELALEMDFEFKQGTRKNPTVKEIREMAKRMEEEGLFGCESSESEDSDDEDQYEAPQLPNFFCCMICFEGTRCTIVDPCRHIFACKDCIEDLLGSYKICVLCAKNITGYEPLEITKDNSE